MPLYVSLYDSIVPQSGGRSYAAFLAPENLLRYTTRAERSIVDGAYHYDVGRLYALEYGWDSIRRDATTLLVGMGLGARGESRTLGSAGRALLAGDLALTAGTSSLVIMQELGLFGVVVLFGCLLWLASVLYRGVDQSQSNAVSELCLSLLMFSLLWPIWLSHSAVWYARLPMLLYWIALGYALRSIEFRQPVRSTPAATAP